MLSTKKSFFVTSPGFQKSDDNISGHVFYFLLAHVLLKAQQDRIESKERKPEQADVIKDVDKIHIVTVGHQEKSFIILTETTIVACKGF